MVTGSPRLILLAALSSALVWSCGSGDDSTSYDAVADGLVEASSGGLDASVPGDAGDSGDATSEAGDATLDAGDATPNAGDATLDGGDSAEPGDASNGPTFCVADGSGSDAAHSYPNICTNDLSCNYGDPAFDPCNPALCDRGGLCLTVRHRTGFGVAPDNTPCDDHHPDSYAYPLSGGCPSNKCTGGANDGAACTSDSACPGGTCFMDRCVDGPGAGSACSTNADCNGGAPNAACVHDNFLSAPHCSGGAENGNSCHLKCVGGSYDGAACNSDNECLGTVNGKCSDIPNSPECPPAGKCVRWTANAATGTCAAVASNPFCNTNADCPTTKYCALDPRNTRWALNACIGDFAPDDCCDPTSWGPCLVWDTCDTVHHVCLRTHQGGETVTCGARTVYKYGDAPCGLSANGSIGTVCNDVCMAGSCTSRYVTCSAACAPGATRCFGNGVERCDLTGQWSPSVACSGDASSCVNGVCLGPPQEAGAVTATSCLAGGAGLSNCGPGGSGNESCCTTLDVTGGTYDRTYINAGDGGTREADPATVSNFRLDKYLVTVGRFRQFVGAWNGGAGYRPPAGSGKHAHLNAGAGLTRTVGGYEPGWLSADDVHVAPTDANLGCDSSYATWTATPSGARESLPINCVNWYEAYAFCIWDGGFLPSDAEWEYAAAGGAQQREYPWGSAPPGTGNQYAIYGCFYPDSSGNCTGVSNLAPVGTPALGAGLFGQLDLTGDVQEWALDLYASYVDPCTDCASLTSGSGPVVRAGDFSYGTTFLPSAWRGYGFASSRGGHIGFRCARMPGGSADSGSPMGVCTPGSTQCSGNAVQTCGPTGQWGPSVACGSNVPVCADGACTAPSLDGGSATPTSCLPSGTGRSNCGPGGAGNESCCASLEVAGGTYDRTYWYMGDAAVGEADPATVSGFRLDKYLVTVGRFRQFVSAWNTGAGYVPAPGSGKHAHLNGGQGLMTGAADAGAAYEPGWLASNDANVAPTDANLTCDPSYATWTPTPTPTGETLPISCVNWYEAYAFCIWDGGFLPSDAELEYAAAGGNQQREYPWGGAAPGTGNQYAIYNCYFPSGSGNCVGEANIAPVGSAALGAGLWGQLDLAGNLREWILDSFAFYYINPCVDCAHLPAGDWKLRGGDFNSPSLELSSSQYVDTSSSSRNDSFGFRCARTP